MDDFQNGERVIIDKEYRNACEVTIVKIFPKRLLVRVKHDDGEEWTTMLSRLTKK